MANDCPIHSGQMNEHNRHNLDSIIRELPENQAGDGRHRCAYCAYLDGLIAGYEKARAEKSGSSSI